VNQFWKDNSGSSMPIRQGRTPPWTERRNQSPGEESRGPRRCRANQTKLHRKRWTQVSKYEIWNERGTGELTGSPVSSLKTKEKKGTPAEGSPQTAVEKTSIVNRPIVTKRVKIARNCRDGTQGRSTGRVRGSPLGRGGASKVMKESRRKRLP